ncbi:calcium-activated chloride channel-domain-containing protein [Gamsiella multidivaricata]|uniref:calcium-activated chloride channel-domain-containing protein n=1 Tax=Gamsiella multidivaricata TaxID=101098 RepID=UPI00221EDE3C|nr:calcium-activated chloride channel-domain-containing protein [Gamsiella multidivaricata]KAI7816372.1 calcium-activated chloride channel-domain-containing protein [Gamsiella multidivaricata]
MIFKYPIPEHLRKVSDVPPAVGLGPSLSDIEIDSTSSDAVARKEERLEKQRQLLNQQEKERLAALEREKDVEAAPMDSKIAKAEELERLQIRFKKAMLRESLVIEEEPNIDGDEMYMKVYAPFWRLCIEAQRLRYKVELTHIPTEKEKAASDAAVSNAEGRGAWARRFWQLIQRFDHVSLPLRAESLLFKASKLRQYALAEKSRKWSDIVRHGGGIQPDGSGVGSNMGTDGKDGFFGTARRGNLTESIVIRSKIRTKRGDRYALRTVVDKKAITDMFTLHDGSYKSKVKPIPNRRTLLFNEWIRIRRPQPLEEIRFYYGEKIALYFAWIDFYTKWLVSAAIVGFVFLIFGLINYFYLKGDAFLPNNEVGAQLVDIFDNALTLPFTLFMAVWSSLFVEYWKRKSNVLAYQWNTLDFERHERARPEFKPTGTRISPVTGKMELYYPRYKQLISIIISILVVLISIAIVIVSVGSLILLNVWLKNGHGHLNSYVVTVITAILNLVVIMILGTVYSRIAKILTDNENHRRLTQYEDALIVKRFLFDFVNFYSALVYIAYFKDNIGSTLINKEEFHDRCPNDSCMGELTIQLAIVFVGKQFLNQFQELAVPQAKKWWNLKNELAEKTVLKGKYKDKKNMVKPPQWAKDDTLPNYDPSMFEEYRELVIQFGFCTLFVTAFPIAPIFALLNNVLERRVDAYKLLTQHRRPIAQHTQDIGSWSIILMLLTHVSVLTNALLIAFRSKWMENNVFMKLPWVAQSGDNMYALLAVRLLFIFIFEHLVFIFKVGIANLVRDQPRTVKLAIERENYYARLALDDEEPAMDEVLEDHDTDTDESEDEDIYDLHKKLLDDNYTNYEEKDGIPGGGSTSPSGDGNDRLGDPAADDEEDEEELEALIKAGGCGCAAHGDGNVGTAKSGFEGTWMSRFKPDAQAALRRRQQRRKRKQNAKKAVDEI